MTVAERVDDGLVMQIWRECGLPEYFLGNGGSNHKLVELARAIRRPYVDALAPFADEAERLRNYPDDYPYSLPATPITVGHLRRAHGLLREFA